MPLLVRSRLTTLPHGPIGRRQGTGHDTLYPSLDIVNEALGTREDLYRLAREAKAKYDTIISYHINTDEAYSNYSEYRRDASGKLSFVDGLQNSDVNERMLALNPDGTGYEWGPNHNQFAYDPLQGPAYHLSKTKDFVSGQRIKRLEKVFDTIPVDLSLHCDAWRDINLSYENTTEDDPWCGCPCLVNPCGDRHACQRLSRSRSRPSPANTRSID